MSRINDALARVTADRVVTPQEVDRELSPVLDTLPHRATPETRALLEILADESLRIEGPASARLQEYLIDRGYDLLRPYQRNVHTPSGVRSEWVVERPRPSDVRDLIRRNVSERDDAFEEVARLSGRTQGRVDIGLVDLPVSYEHPALEGRVWRNPGEIGANRQDDERNGFVDDVHGYDFVAGREARTSRTVSHGTSVASIATRGTDRVQAITTTALGGAENTPIWQSIDYAIAQGARVVNLSLSFFGQDALQEFRARLERHPNVLFVLAAGNEGMELRDGGDDPHGATSIAPNLIVVAAGTHWGGVWSVANDLGTNYGSSYVTVAAPGGYVIEAVPPSAGTGRYYTIGSGSSLAAPWVTNLAAKCLALNPGLTPSEVRRIITLTCDRSAAWDGKVESGGMVNNQRAMQVAAILGMVRAGVSPEDAAHRLRLRGEERDRVLDCVWQLSEP